MGFDTPTFQSIYGDMSKDMANEMSQTCQRAYFDMLMYGNAMVPVEKEGNTCMEDIE